MAKLTERLDQVEAALDAEDDQQTLVIMLVGDERDLREMPAKGEDWAIYPRLLAESPPFGPRLILLDPDDERRLRVEQAATN